MTEKPGVILICGKVCCGKSTYAAKLARETGGEILSCDEVMLKRYPVLLGDRHEALAAQVRAELREEALRLILSGRTVILDWGFWNRQMRRETEAFFRPRGITPRWLYLKIDEAEWLRRVTQRNREAPAGVYPVDEGLIEKCRTLFEEPEPGEMEEIEA